VLAGLGLGIAELVRGFRRAFPEKESATRTTPPRDAVGRELERALVEAQERNAVIVTELERAHGAKIGELQSMVRGLVDELRRAKAENARLRAASAEADPTAVTAQPAGSDAPEAESRPLASDGSD
jgi:hypothetical protein